MNYFRMLNFHFFRVPGQNHLQGQPPATAIRISASIASYPGAVCQRSLVHSYIATRYRGVFWERGGGWY